MKKLLSFILSIVLFGSSVSFAFAQDIPNALDAIKGGLQEKGITIVDYSDSKPFGNLDGDIVTRLKAKGVNNLTELIEILPSTQTAHIILWAAVNLYGTEAESTGAVNTNTLNNLLTQIAENPAVDVSGEVKMVLKTLPISVVDQINQLATEIQYSGESQINSVLLEVARTMRNVIGGIAIIFIVITGMQMVMASGDESKITEQKTAITWSIIGLISIILAERMITIIYGVSGVERGIGIDQVGPLFSTEVLGIVAYIKAIVAAVAVFMIVISGLRTIFAAGDEEKIRKQRSAVLWVVVGLVLIVINKVIIENIYVLPSATDIFADEKISQGNINNIIGLLGNLIQFILGFVGVFALGGLIYGALLMVMNLGNDETVEKAKKIIKATILGIVVIIASFALISTLVVDFGAAF